LARKYCDWPAKQSKTSKAKWKVGDGPSLYTHQILNNKICALKLSKINILKFTFIDI